MAMSGALPLANGRLDSPALQKLGPTIGSDKLLMRDRLAVFPRSQVDEIRARMEPIPMVLWPRLAGCLAILFTARSGSTFLCRELESQFDLGSVRESLNPPPYIGAIAMNLVKKRGGQWLGLKAGVAGVIAGELSGFFQTYIDRTSFILLRRRDVVAQAVSRVKADQTGKWHTVDEQCGEAQYDAVQITANIRRLVESHDLLRAYVRMVGRPWTSLLYEDFAEGVFDAPLAACDHFGAPRLVAGAKEPRRVERVGDEVNEAWIARFKAEMPPDIREVIAAYEASL